ncbi:MAG: hypothetical protein LWW85_14385 [Marinilabiliales bacterium]|nr:hypothetical protein [Marinilabiliales bacterium]
MEQKDYLLREIEKIGVLLRWIRELFFAGRAEELRPMEAQWVEMKSRLAETGLEVDRFLASAPEERVNYLEGLSGYNVENIELLADCLARISLPTSTDSSKQFQEIALQLYALCDQKSRSYSLERAHRMASLRQALGIADPEISETDSLPSEG